MDSLLRKILAAALEPLEGRLPDTISADWAIFYCSHARPNEEERRQLIDRVVSSRLIETILDLSKPQVGELRWCVLDNPKCTLICVSQKVSCTLSFYRISNEDSDAVKDTALRDGCLGSW